MADQETDELSGYFDGTPPRVIVTTSDKPVGDTFKFAESLINIFPTAEFIPRKGVPLKKIIRGASERGFGSFSRVPISFPAPTPLATRRSSLSICWCGSRGPPGRSIFLRKACPARA